MTFWVALAEVFETDATLARRARSEGALAAFALFCHWARYWGVDYRGFEMRPPLPASGAVLTGREVARLGWSRT